MRDDDRSYYDPVERQELSEEDQVLADLMSEYMTRRRDGVAVIYPDLQARARRLGPRAAANFEDLVSYWELKRLEGEA